MTIKIKYFWARPIKIINIQSKSLYRKCWRFGLDFLKHSQARSFLADFFNGQDSRQKGTP